jgi:hypothetical protein
MEKIYVLRTEMLAVLMCLSLKLPAQAGEIGEHPALHVPAVG